ncbi:MAG: hypothetical protein VB092_09500 [Oscillospiraceae bacterium]|nr:hypothetical protein [Oscillospiraceae bacterium]
MKKRFFAVILAAFVFACLLPRTAAAAAATSVYVGGTQLNEGESTTVYGGTASFSGGVLTLNGATVPSTASYSETSFHAAVYASGDLTIELVGSNSVTAPDVTSGSSYGIYVAGTGCLLTIQGSGSLSATGGASTDSSGGSAGICSCAVTISSGTVVATGGATKGTTSGILSKSTGDITINGGTVTATGGTGDGGDSTTAKSNGIYNSSVGSILINGGTVVAAGGRSNTGSRGMQIDNGSISITGGTVTSTGGEVTPNPSQSDLSIHSYGIYAGGGTGGIQISGGTVVGSGGTANASGTTSTSFGIYARNSSISVSGGVVTAAGGPAAVNSYGIYTKGTTSNVTISAGTVKATADTADTDSRGIYSSGSITVSGGGVVAAGDTSGVNKLPAFGTTWYQWKANTSKADPGGSYTDSATTAFTAYDTSRYLRVLPAGGADPVITDPTADKTVGVYVAYTAAMSVTAQNAASYQWYKNGGSGFAAISGATGASYTTPTAALSNNGDQYYCIVSGIAGTFPVTSKVFTLSVTVPPDPSITDPTVNKTFPVTAGSAATLRVTAQNAVGYQWYADEGSGFSAVSGATSASYTTAATTLSDDGFQYYCVVSGATGTSPAASGIFTLNVTPPTAGRTNPDTGVKRG